MVVLDTAARLTTTWPVSTVLNNSAVYDCCGLRCALHLPAYPESSRAKLGVGVGSPSLDPSLYFFFFQLRRVSRPERKKMTDDVMDHVNGINSPTFPPELRFSRLTWRSNVTRERERERNGSPCLGLLSRSLENRSGKSRVIF